ncbi:MAG: hypothetical protein KDC81_10105 [Flavobacteriaceae bacterium]|nr:hypothetical protein [Flavobacteriaceae bacterium]
MNDRYILIATAVLVAFFFVGGLLDILDHFLSKMFLFVGFLGIVIYVIVIKAQDEPEEQ